MGSRIRPPPLEDVVGQDAVPDVQIVHVRDLVLPRGEGVRLRMKEKTFESYI